MIRITSQRIDSVCGINNEASFLQYLNSRGNMFGVGIVFKDLKAHVLKNFEFGKAKQ